MSFTTAEVLHPLPIDPKLPVGFDNTPNDERSSAELDAWWDQPYLITMPDGSFVARVLDGGCWDRPTTIGAGATVEEATTAGLAKFESWKLFRSRPMAQLEGGKVHVVIMPQRPAQEATVLASDLTYEQATAYIESFDSNKPTV